MIKTSYKVFFAHKPWNSKIKYWPKIKYIVKGNFFFLLSLKWHSYTFIWNSLVIQDLKVKIIAHDLCKPRFNILLHTQSIVCATVDGQCLEYLVYITLTALLVLAHSLALICKSWRFLLDLNFVFIEQWFYIWL